jgi:ankyrin repeat protein
MEGNLEVVRCLIVEFGADVNERGESNATPLYCAAQEGQLDVVRYLVEHGADVNQCGSDGQTPLMIASEKMHGKIIRYLLKHGANAQSYTTSRHSAADISEYFGAPITQTEYLEAKAHCTNPDCSGTGLKKCTGCKKVRYCGQACQLAHWKVHNADCRVSKEA